MKTFLEYLDEPSSQATTTKSSKGKKKKQKSADKDKKKGKGKKKRKKKEETPREIVEEVPETIWVPVSLITQHYIL